MASGGKRTAGERVLESKHVIGLFFVMLLFSGVFFSLGYVMGRNQYDSQVRAATAFASNTVAPKPAAPPKKSSPPPVTNDADPATQNVDSDFRFYENNKPAAAEPHLEPAPK